jgi:hypothetical protein
LRRSTARRSRSTDAQKENGVAVVHEQQEPDQRPDEGEAAPAPERPWTKEQCDRVADAFTANQPLVCPNCASPLLTSESPGPKRTTIVSFICVQCRVGVQAPFKVFDPRDFIQPPFVKCPQCGGAEFGVLMVHGDNYTRRCQGSAPSDQAEDP